MTEEHYCCAGGECERKSGTSTAEPDDSCKTHDLYVEIARLKSEREISAEAFDAACIECERLRALNEGNCARAQSYYEEVQRLQAELDAMDEAPPLTDEQLARADLYHGDRLVRRGAR